MEPEVIAGHFGFAAGVKSREREVPLWALMLACQWLDVLFVPLLLLGVEGLQPIDTGGYGKVIIHAWWTHSLLGALVLSAALGACFRGRARFVIAAVSFSHWVLDVLVHRADMPLLPANWGGLPLLGLGLWRWPTATAGIELLLVLAGGGLYWHAARQVGARDPANAAAAVVITSGLVTLALNLAGL